MGPEPDLPLDRAVAELVAELAPRGGGLPALPTPLSDLGFDSLALADLAVAVEERFGVRLADRDPPALETVGDVVARVLGPPPVPGPRLPEGLGRLQGTAEALFGRVIRWWCRLEVAGAGNVPREGPVILAANHRSMLDIPVHVLASPRPIVFMGKRELFGDPFRRWLWRALGGFAVRRDVADLGAIDAALAVLEGGGALGVYPEGTRSRTGEMLPFLHGAAWLALLTGAPIVPCGIRGTRRAPGEPRLGRLLRWRVRVAFGPPIRVEREPDPRARRRRAAAVTEQLLRAVTELSAG